MMTFFAYICLPLTKAMLPYIRAPHLVCIEETMQSTPVCQWKSWRVTAWRMQERLSLFSVFVPVAAGKSLDGWDESEEREKQNQARQKNNLDSWLAGLWR